MFRSLRKRWLCWKYGICQTHGMLMERGGYNQGRWMCRTCIEENQARWLFAAKGDELARVRAQEQLNRDWAIRETQRGE